MGWRGKDKPFAPQDSVFTVMWRRELPNERDVDLVTLLIGGMVIVFNYLPFRLEEARIALRRPWCR